MSALRSVQMSKTITIVWFRQDLRIADNPALWHGCQRGLIVPVYIHGNGAEGERRVGSASKWWLHHSLAALQASLGKLLVIRGDPQRVLDELLEKTGASAVHWNRCYEPQAIKRDKEIKSALREKDIEARSFNASLLNEPWEIRTGNGEPYKVFTPYWRAAGEKQREQPLPSPREIEFADCSQDDGLDALNLLPEKPNWAKGWGDLWQPGEAGALTRFETFIGGGLRGYDTKRDRPDLAERFAAFSTSAFWRDLSSADNLEN